MKGGRKIARVLVVLLFASLATLPAPLPTSRPSGLRHFSTPPPDAAGRRLVADAYGRLPMAFEANRGQTDPQVQFLARGRGYALFLTALEAVMVLTPPQRQDATRLEALGIPAPGRESLASVRPSVVRMTLVGARPSATLAGLDELSGKVNYFIGNDPKKWRTNIPTYAKVQYRGVYPGVDLVYYGIGRQLEYDFVVAPGSHPSTITLGFEGADTLEVDAGGDLLLRIAGGRSDSTGRECIRRLTVSGGRSRPGTSCAVRTSSASWWRPTMYRGP